MNSHEEQRFPPVDPPRPDPIRLITTRELMKELKRRSIGCMLVALVMDDAGLTKWELESKGTGNVFKDVLMNVELEKIQRDNTNE